MQHLIGKVVKYMGQTGIVERVFPAEDTVEVTWMTTASQPKKVRIILPLREVAFVPINGEKVT